MNHTVSELTHRAQASEISVDGRKFSYSKRADYYNSGYDVKETLDEKTDDSFPKLCDKGGSTKRAINISSKIKSMASSRELRSTKGHIPFDNNICNSINDEVNLNRSNAETKHTKARRRTSLPSSFPAIFKYEANISNKLTHRRKMRVPDDQEKGKKTPYGEKDVCKPKKDYSSLKDNNFLPVDKNVDNFLISSEKKRWFIIRA